MPLLIIGLLFGLHISLMLNIIHPIQYPFKIETFGESHSNILKFSIDPTSNRIYALSGSYTNFHVECYQMQTENQIPQFLWSYNIQNLYEYQYIEDLEVDYKRSRLFLSGFCEVGNESSDNLDSFILVFNITNEGLTNTSNFFYGGGCWERGFDIELDIIQGLLYFTGTTYSYGSDTYVLCFDINEDNPIMIWNITYGHHTENDVGYNLILDHTTQHLYVVGETDHQIPYGRSSTISSPFGIITCIDVGLKTPQFLWNYSIPNISDLFLQFDSKTQIMYILYQNVQKTSINNYYSNAHLQAFQITENNIVSLWNKTTPSKIFLDVKGLFYDSNNTNLYVYGDYNPNIFLSLFIGGTPDTSIMISYQIDNISNKSPDLQWILEIPNLSVNSVLINPLRNQVYLGGYGYSNPTGYTFQLTSNLSIFYLFPLIFLIICFGLGIVFFWFIPKIKRIENPFGDINQILSVSSDEKKNNDRVFWGYFATDFYIISSFSLILLFFPVFLLNFSTTSLNFYMLLFGWDITFAISSWINFQRIKNQIQEDESRIFRVINGIKKSNEIPLFPIYFFLGVFGVINLFFIFGLFIQPVLILIVSPFIYVKYDSFRYFQEWYLGYPNFIKQLHKLNVLIPTSCIHIPTDLVPSLSMTFSQVFPDFIYPLNKIAIFFDITLRHTDQILVKKFIHQPITCNDGWQFFFADEWLIIVISFNSVFYRFNKLKIIFQNLISHWSGIPNSIQPFIQNKQKSLIKTILLSSLFLKFIIICIVGLAIIVIYVFGLNAIALIILFVFFSLLIAHRLSLKEIMSYIQLFELSNQIDFIELGLKLHRNPQKLKKKITTIFKKFEEFLFPNFSLMEKDHILFFAESGEMN